MKFITQYKGLPSRIYTICIARTITAMGMFIFSFTTLILTTVLEYSEVVSGYVLMSASICGIIGSFLFGRLADIHGRKKVLQIILSIGALNLFIGGIICRTVFVIPVILISTFIFSGVLPIIAAMVTDWSSDENRTQSFSLMYLCVNFGFSIGQVFAGILFYEHYPFIFWGQGLGWFLTVIIVGLFIKDDFVPVGKIPKKKRPAIDREGLISLVMKDKILIGFIIIVILMNFCHNQISFMIPLQYKSAIGLEKCSLLISRIWLINGISCVAFTPVITLIMRKFTVIRTMFFATVIYIAAFGIYAMGNNIILYMAVVPFWTCGEIIMNTAGGIFIAARAPEAYRARYQSLNGFAGSFGNCVAPVIMSYVLIGHTYLQGWKLVSFVSFTAMLIMALILKYTKKSPPCSVD